MTMTRDQQEARARDILIAVHFDGKSTSSLAMHYGVKNRTIRHIAVGRSYPDVYREVMNAEPEVIRSEAEAAQDALVHRVHKLWQEGHSRASIADACGITQHTASQYIGGRRRHDIWEQYNGSAGANLLMRAWGPATKPGGVPVECVL